MDEVTAAAGRLAIGLGFWVLVDIDDDGFPDSSLLEEAESLMDGPVYALMGVLVGLFCRQSRRIRFLWQREEHQTLVQDL
eukprot:scaffold18030_cov64-Cyclotella_meneghiniana.AAC.1